MKHLLLLVFFFSMAISPLNLLAQTGSSTLYKQLIEANEAKVSFNKATNTPNFIRFSKEKHPVLIGSSVEEKAQSFLSIYGEIFGIQQPAQELFLSEIREDLALGQHLVFIQKKDNIPVFGSDFRLHFDANLQLTAVNGYFIPDIELNTTPILSENEVAQIALNTVQHQQPNITPALEVLQQELMIFRTGLVQRSVGKDYLTYQIEIGNRHNLREFVYVDAQKGDILEQFTGMHEAKFRRLQDYDAGPPATYTEVWAEGDAFPGSLDAERQTELAAAGHTYNLFFYTFNRDSYDGNGAEMLTVHNAPINCPNANWNGTSTNYCSGLAADDVVAHEWGHAITEYTANLIYAWQAGALNESYSDIWGETVDLLNGYGNDTNDNVLRNDCDNGDLRWQIGEDATALANPLRDMYDPNCDGDPGKVSDAQYVCGTGDSGGVHTNSGVNNHAFSLLTDGGTYNGQTVSGIGLTKSAHIFWQSLNVYLTRVSDFADQADALEAACSDLIGINLNTLTTGSATSSSGQIISLVDCQQVTNVINAVELRTPPSQCNFSPMLDTNTPDPCSGGATMENIFVDDFETGVGMWTISEVPSDPVTWEPRPWESATTLPDGRAGKAAFANNPVNGNCNTDLQNGIVRLQSPVISVPAAANPPVKMMFDHNVATELNWDGGNLKYSLNNGAWTLVPAAAFSFNDYNKNLNTVGQGNDNPLQGQAAFTGANGGSVKGSWGQSQLDLSVIGVTPGDDFQIRFELGSDGCNGWFGWYLDDVKVYTCSALLPIEMVHFRVEAVQDYLHLEWLTASESNNYGFEIQRSTSPAGGFEKIAFLLGQGSSDKNTHYGFDDFSVENGVTYYYRLRQIDFDDSESFSEIKTGKIDNGINQEFSIFPNPTADVVRIKLTNPAIDYGQINVFDVDGKVVFTKNNLTFENGASELNLQALPTGIYFLQIIDSQKIWTERLVKY